MKSFAGAAFPTCPMVLFLMLGSACSITSKPLPLVHTTAPQVKWDGSVESLKLSRQSAVTGARGMVVADDRIAAEWGAEILRQGGNAIDAAVATGFAMSVTRPHYAALGGGGFLVYCPKPGPMGALPCETLDYREKAPTAATRDMYIHDGKGLTELSQNGALASGVPGVPAGLLAALEKWGTRPRESLLQKPIQLAREGFPMSSYTELAAAERWNAFNAEAKRIFGCGIAPCPPGTSLKQPDLARVLEEISHQGSVGFYEGWVADRLVRGLRAAGGIVTLEDLKKFAPTFRAPVRGIFHEMEVVSMPPPSAGGTLLIQMLRYADRADEAGALMNGFGSARAIHALAHGMALAFADRAQHFGDPGFAKVPVAGLLSNTYIDDRWNTTYNSDKIALPPAAGEASRYEPQNTTHFSVIDREGNAVAITTTVNENFGSGFVPPGTGVVMNNEMDDFSIQPGVPNLFGLVGTEANSVAPGKRPLSSMSPTIVRDSRGNSRLVLGAAGGPRITTAVYQCILNRLRFEMSLPDAVAAPRFHHQWKPEELRLEQWGFPHEVEAQLKLLGYTTKMTPALAKVHALERFPNGRTWGVPDPRGEGAAVAE